MAVISYNILLMKNNLQNRREFFKKAAKGVLPILGAIVLSSIPFNASAVNKDSTYCEHCNSSCSNGCRRGCSQGCGSSCYTNCQGHTHKYHPSNDCETCRYYCAGCTGQCSGTCSGSCKGGAYKVN